MKVYIYPADLHGCGHYRLIWIGQYLAAQGHDVVVSYPGGRRVAPNKNAKPTKEAMRAALRGRAPRAALGVSDPRAELKGQLDEHGNTVGVTAPKDADVMVMQRLTHKGIVQAIPIWRANGIAVVVDVDDDLSTIHPANPAFKALHPKDGKQNFGWQWCLKACELATLVTTSTPALIERYASHGRGVVLPNCVPERYLRIPHADSNVIGWGGTVATHPTDLQMTGSAIGQVLDQTGTSFTVVGPPNGVEPALGLRGRNWRATGGVPLSQWPHVLAQSIGIGIAPLADTMFNAAKSALKILEYSGLGIPVVMSPRADYVRLHKHGVGILANKPKEWRKELLRLVNHEGARRELSERGRSAASDWTIEGNGWRWLEAWAHALALQRGPVHSTTVRTLDRSRSS